MWDGAKISKAPRKRSGSKGGEGEEEGGVRWGVGDQTEKRTKKTQKKEASRMQGKKSLESIFSTTGLDPKAEVRRKVKKKARKVARRSRNKKRGAQLIGKWRVIELERGECRGGRPRPLRTCHPYAASVASAPGGLLCP